MPKGIFRLPVVLAVYSLLASQGLAYSVLTHEAVIDAAWQDSIRPLLLKRYPQASPEDLKEAHAYAYGGAIIQDMGYYPFGSHFFSDLTHYVRSGDFIMALIGEAQNVDEYAFALGALAHYASDNVGHPVATNLAVPIMMPKLRRKFGSVMTYEEDPAAHLEVEFSFDVVEVANGNYAPQAYHDFIGFKVAKPVLERAFEKTYSIPMRDIYVSEDLAIGSYRRAVSTLIPEMTKAAWDLKKNDIVKAHPSMTERKFIYNVSHADYSKEWGDVYEKPGIGARILAFFVRILPKVGPLRDLKFRPPPARVQTMFMRSFNDALALYRQLLKQQERGALRLPDRNLDTGAAARPGSYRLMDTSYAKLVEKLKGKPVSPELRANILKYYSDPTAAYATKSHPKAWTKLQADLAILRLAD